jgi:hypothetical protein
MSVDPWCAAMLRSARQDGGCKSPATRQVKPGSSGPTTRVANELGGRVQGNSRLTTLGAAIRPADAHRSASAGPIA